MGRDLADTVGPPDPVDGDGMDNFDAEEVLDDWSGFGNSLPSTSWRMVSIKVTYSLSKLYNSHICFACVNFSLFNNESMILDNNSSSTFCKFQFASGKVKSPIW